MKKLKFISLFTTICFLLAGCFGQKAGPPAEPGQSPTSSSTAAPLPGATTPGPTLTTATAEPSPTPVIAADSPLRLWLDQEPRLAAPLSTLVADTPQRYTMQFRDPMNRHSVEETIRKQTKLPGGIPNADLKLSFDWSSDKELRITADAQVASPDLYPLKEYAVDANGALTLDDQALRDAPTFRAIVRKPDQLWRIAADGSRVERMSALTEPYFLHSLGGDSRYMLASRFTKYCECDASYPMLYGVYDTVLNTLTRYPFPLSTDYTGGPGDLTVDTRGFLYAKPTAGMNVPISGTTVSVHVDTFIFGTGLSRDRQYLLVAAGKENQERDLDLVVYDLQKGTFRTIPAALKGHVPESQVSSAPVPVEFLDDGQAMYIRMDRTNESGEVIGEVNLRYEWASGTVIEWTPMIPETAWSGFLPSEDGKYRYYYNGGMYRGEEPISNKDEPTKAFKINGRPGLWLNGTHKLLYTDWIKQAGQDGLSHTALISFDADSGQTRTLIELPASMVSLIGSSADAQWIYVATATDLSPT